MCDPMSSTRVDKMWSVLNNLYYRIGKFWQKVKDFFIRKGLDSIVFSIFIMNSKDHFKYKYFGRYSKIQEFLIIQDESIIDHYYLLENII